MTAVGKEACGKPGVRVGVAVRVASETYGHFIHQHGGMCDSNSCTPREEWRRGTAPGYAYGAEREVALARGRVDSVTRWRAGSVSLFE